MTESPKRQRVAVVGAGISGLVCARTLRLHGISVSVFDKARGPGGRMSTRREPTGSFDHGAQYFTACDPRFEHQVESWRSAGLVAVWDPRLVVLESGARMKPAPDPQPRRFVGVPTMSALTRGLSDGLELVCGSEIFAVEHWQNGFYLDDGDGWSGGFDGVVLAIPGPQAADLLDPDDPVGQVAVNAELAPCLAAMASFGSWVEVPFDAAFVRTGPLSWVARNSSKPGRSLQECWVLHAEPDWSRTHFGDPEFARGLMAAFADAVGTELPEPIAVRGHRWRYALPVAPLEQPFLFDPERNLGACGDWCAGPRVEAAYLSGLALAERMLASFGLQRIG